MEEHAPLSILTGPCGYFLSFWHVQLDSCLCNDIPPLGGEQVGYAAQDGCHGAPATLAGQPSKVQQLK